MAMIGCSEAMRQLWEYLDGMVSDADQALIAEHLERCRRCCGELEFAEELRSLLARTGQAEDSAPQDDVLRRLNETVEGIGP